MTLAEEEGLAIGAGVCYNIIEGTHRTESERSRRMQRYKVTFTIGGSTVEVIEPDFRSAIDFVMDFADIIKPTADFVVEAYVR